MNSSHIDINKRMAAIQNCLRQKNSRVHLLGICGVGMAGLALLLKKKGFQVSGCDQTLNPLTGWLRRHGITVVSGHAPAHVAPADWLIKSTAVPDDIPELSAARQARKKIFRRGLVLAEIAAAAESICVCGTHGKTTTTAMLAQVLQAAGRQPAFCIGGAVPGLGGVAGAGSGANLVLEADESDGTLAAYRPARAVITNIEFDHAEYFRNFSALAQCFRRLADQTRGKIIYCRDDRTARKIMRGRKNAWSYGFSAGADFRLINFRENSAGLDFSLKINGRDGILPSAAGNLPALPGLKFLCLNISLPVPGRHNALNAAAACAAALELGVPFAEITGALKKFQPAARRFEKIVETGDRLVIADYAHHPSEIAALLGSVRALKPRRWRAVFQPHRYSRTRALGRLFPPAWRGVAELVLCPVYAASEKIIPGGTSFDLYKHFRQYGRTPVFCARSLRQAWDYLKTKIAAGDGLLIVGAGDVIKIGGWAKKELTSAKQGNLPVIPRPAAPRERDEGSYPRLSIPPRFRATLGMTNSRASKLSGLELKSSSVKFHEPLAPKTTLRVGGAADIFIEVGDPDELAAIVGWAGKNHVPIRVLGAGSNVLVSDLGVRGMVLRLKGAAWQTMRLEKNGRVVAGAGLSLAQLLNWAAQAGWTGAEFLTAIPGTIGGAVRMNAGAWGHAIGGLIAWVKVMEPDGRITRLNQRQLRFAYRACPGLENRIVMAAALKLKKGKKASIRKKMAQIRQRRKWLRGLRSAGSIFKNPPGAAAGRLIENTGLKGLAIGGARVARQHANVISANKNANASDVMSLIEIIRLSVRIKYGVDLESEVEYWE